MKLIVLIALLGVAVAKWQQAVAAKGRLKCDNRSAYGVMVRLIGKNRDSNPDDILDEAFTDRNGEFRLKGSKHWLIYHPMLKVYHDCDDGIKPGQRKVTFHIPDYYVSAGGVAKSLYDVGVINLETIFLKEERHVGGI